jgi:hypothetical protein
MSPRVNLLRRFFDDLALTVSGATDYKPATERGGAGANGPGCRAQLGKLLHLEVCINSRSVVDCRFCVGVRVWGF